MTSATAWPLSRNQHAPLERTNELNVEGEARLYRALRHCWHPVIYSHELAGEPKQVVLCGEQLVVVRLNGQARAFNDLCAHRGTALSLGCVVVGSAGDELRCPYHGWQYDEQGRCTVAPQRIDLAGHLRARVRSYQVEEAYGMVWVCLVDEPAFPLPRFPQFDDPSFHKAFVPSTDWRCSAPRRTENYTDLAHFSVVHPGVLGDPGHPEVPPHSVERRDDHLFMQLDGDAFEPAGVAKNTGLRHDGEQMLRVRKQWHLFMPLTVLLDQTEAGDQRYCLFFHPSPIGPRAIRNFTVAARNFGDPDRAQVELAGFSEMVYGQDKPVVESQRPEELSEDLSFEMHLKGVDTLSITYRKWLVELARTFGNQ